LKGREKEGKKNQVSLGRKVLERPADTSLLMGFFNLVNDLHVSEEFGKGSSSINFKKKEHKG